TLWPTTGKSWRTHVQPIETLGSEGERERAVLVETRKLAPAEEVVQHRTCELFGRDGRRNRVVREAEHAQDVLAGVPELGARAGVRAHEGEHGLVARFEHRYRAQPE